MAEGKIVSPPKIGSLIPWLLFIIISGSVVLSITSLRVGQQNETTYGQVYKDFAGSWGGEINIIPADFYFENQDSEKEYVLPRSIFINSNIRLDKKREGLITFNSFIVDMENEYILKNTSGFQNNLFIKFNWPENSNIIYDYLVFIANQLLEKEYNIDDPFILLSEFGQNQEIKIKTRFTTNGIDIFRYKLDVYDRYVMQSFKAIFNIIRLV
ncbi:MAG: hypothetical protein LBK74_11670 [Treponema sp.]|nr:hypothetical protein [Treponema sp.]